MTKENLSTQTLLNLEEIAYEIIEIRKKLKIGSSSLSPLNYREEMNKFFKSKTYNPTFTYLKSGLENLPKRIDAIKLKIEKLNLPVDLSEHILDVLEDLKKMYFTKKSIGTKDFSKNAHDLFDWGTDRLDILLTKTSNVEFQLFEKHRLQDALKIKERFEKALSKYNLEKKYIIKINELNSHVIRAGFKSIEIGSEIQRYECNVDRLIVHEIESHILQTHTLKNLKTPLAELTKYGNHNLYSEGLAVYNEIATRKITPSAFEMYYYRIKAVRFLNKSFREIYNILSENLTPTRAYVMTYRVKRGLSDTSAPGGFPKDASYLLGYHEVQSLIDNGFPRKNLYLTKSPILTNLLLKYGIIDDKKILTPKFLK